MGKNVDLTSKEWRDIVFANKNQDFGAYQLRKNSDRRHNMAVLFTLLGLVIVAVLLVAWSKYSDYRAEMAALEAKERAERMSQAQFEAMDDQDEPEEVEEQKFEQPEIQVPEEVLATVQVTQIAIVDADKVKNEIVDMDTQKEDNTARGVVNQEGSNDADKFKAVQEAVVVKPEVKEEPKKEEQIFRAVEQPAEFPGGQAALMKYLNNNIRYPEMAIANDIQGRVHVEFVIERDGSVGHARILKGVDKSLDKEALRVVNSMPRWQPGKNNGVAVRSYFTLPVTFRLQNN